MSEPFQKRYAGAVMNTFGPPRLILVKGRGSYVWDADGKRYLDLLGGIAVNALGHGHPALVGAVTRQLATLGHVSNFFATEPQIELAETLLELVGHDGRIFFTNSGSEANEAALKLTRRTARTHLVAAEGSFHGRTMGALALTSKAAYREPFEPLPGHVSFVAYGDAGALAAAVDDHTAAIVLEPVQGEAGVILPPPDYLRAARAVADRHGALLWLDEVQTGMGRTGDWFAHTEAGVVPDVITLAKGLAGGIPIGACIGVGSAGELLGPGNHGSTFGGNPVAAAAALAVVETIRAEGLLENAVRIGTVLRKGLEHEHVSEVRGRGLLLGLDLDRPLAGAVVGEAQARGFLLNDCTPSRIRLAPPLNLSTSEASEFTDAWPEILDRAYRDDLEAPA